MSTITGPAITSAISLGPVSQILPPQYRFAGDDWDDENAFVFTFFDVLPGIDPVTGAATEGELRELTGCLMTGTVEYAPPPNPFRVPLIWDPQPVAMAGTINIEAGQGTLTLPLSITSGFRRQPPSLWDRATAGDTSGALLIVQARLTDSLGKTATKGRIPLYVF